jgi:nucleotide-binding universal stress UspA family protein
MASNNGGKLITVAIHTYEKAIILKTLLEKEGIETVIHNVNLIQPVISSGVRVRIHEKDLPLALKIIEESSIMTPDEVLDQKEEDAKVLIPIDFSEYSLKACKIGFDFAQKMHGEAVLLHSFVNASFSGLMPFDSDEFENNSIAIENEKALDIDSHEKMRRFEKTIKDAIASGELADVNFSTVITEGVPENAILNNAKEIQPSLIVMGTRGKDKKEADLIGSVTAEVLDAGKFPVLTVPEKISLKHVNDVKNIIFFSNLNQQDLISFDIFARMFDGNNLNITAIPIDDVSDRGVVDSSLNSLLSYCKSHYPDYSFATKRFSEENFINDVDDFVKSAQIDLILVPNKKRNIFARLFNPSIAHRMIFHSDTPMLVVPI